MTNNNPMAKHTCVICKKKFQGWGNNAEPVKKGLCCNKCNMTKVIPVRLGLYL